MGCDYSQITSIIRDCVVALSAIVTASVAVYGVSTWRRQQTWKSEYELSKRIIRLLYLYRDAISGVRYPHMQYDPPDDTHDLPEENQRYEGLKAEYTRR